MDQAVPAELQAYEAHLIEHNRSMGCRAYSQPPFVLFVNDEIHVPWYNYASVAPGGTTPSRAQVDEVIAFYRARGFGPRFSLVLESAPEGTVEVLQAAGLGLEEHEHVMFQAEPVEVPALPGAAFMALPAVDEPAAARILSVSFGSGMAGPEPEWRRQQVARMRAANMHQLGAYLHGQLAAVLNLHTLARVGHITAVATDPQFRRRGLAGALTAYAGALARGEGAELVALEVARPEAERVYARIGFRRAAERVDYAA